MRSKATPVVLGLAVLLAGTACSSSDSSSSATGSGKETPSQAPASVPPLQWGPCPADAAAEGQECATLDAPLDYRDPGGKTIEIAVSRLASANKEQRRGILLTNTGGPGGAGLAYPALLKNELKIPQEVLDTYDVIGMDPRGVGHSTPVTCELTQTDWITNIPLYAATPEAVTAQAEASAAVAKKCAAAPTAEILPHITTANTARDLDLVRQALGEEKASYYGISYGTYLGAVYSSLFPDTTDRVFLDSSSGPGGWDSEFTRGFAQGFETRFPDFAKFVASKPEYGLGSTPQEVQDKYFEIAEKLDKKPSADGFTGYLFRQRTFSEFYYDNRFDELAEIWKALDQGTKLDLPAPETSADASGGSAVPADNYLASQLAVICNDSNWPEDVATYQKNVEADRKAFPMFGAAASNILPCAFWPTEPYEPPVPITDQGPSNILMLQNLRDPATPLAGAEKMRQAFGDRARLVTADEGGHLNYLYLGNTCSDEIVTTFLVSGERPAEDTTCGSA